MVDDIKKLAETGALNGTAGTKKADATKRATGTLGKDEFLQLLVTQLKAQDPLDPMKNDQFAVNLAQFSQLEQLMSINDKVGASGAGNVSSLAGYLGQVVTLDTDTLHVDSGNGGSLKLDLARDANNVTIDLVDSEGNVAESINVGELTAGEHTLSLANIQTPSGDYGFRVKAVSTNAGVFQPGASVVGLVSAFIPAPDAKLIVNGQEVSPGNVVQVNTPPRAAASGTA